jgi:hypothetical protein
MSFVGEIAQTQNMSNKNEYPSHVSDEEWTLTYKNRSLPAPPNVFGMSRAYASHYAGACADRALPWLGSDTAIRYQRTVPRASSPC